MSKISDLKERIDQEIQKRGLEETKTRGMIGLKAGFVLAFITQATPDDPTKIAKLRQAASDVLGIAL